MNNGKDFIGLRFGEWTVLAIEKENNTHRNTQYSCMCSCGRVSLVTRPNLKSGASTKCHSCANPPNVIKDGEISGTFWCRIKSGAKKRNIEFIVTKQFCEALFEKQQRQCSLSGLEIEFPSTNRAANAGEYTASLDRVDSSKPYTEQNVQWVHRSINLMKNALTQEKFIRYCQLVAANHKGEP